MHPMRASRRSVAALLSAIALLAAAPGYGPTLVAARETAAVLAPGNPHQRKLAGEVVEGQEEDEGSCSASSLDRSSCRGGPCECPAQQLQLVGSNLMPRLPVQGDSFLGYEHLRLSGGLELTVYNFKQPRRLSELELPFRILPLQHIDLTNVRVLEVPPKQALDSWFPGFAWSILICERCQGRHLGWKFTPTGSSAGEAFYALIVETVDAEEEEHLSSQQRLLAGVRAVGQPLAAIGLAASIVRSS